MRKVEGVAQLTNTCHGSNIHARAQSWNVLRNPRIARQRKDSCLALRNSRIAQIPTSHGTYIYIDTGPEDITNYTKI